MDKIEKKNKVKPRKDVFSEIKALDNKVDIVVQMLEEIYEIISEEYAEDKEASDSEVKMLSEEDMEKMKVDIEAANKVNIALVPDEI